MPILYQYQQDLFEFFRPLVLNSNRFVLHYVWQDFFHCLATIFFLDQTLNLNHWLLSSLKSFVNL